MDTSKLITKSLVERQMSTAPYTPKGIILPEIDIVDIEDFGIVKHLSYDGDDEDGFDEVGYYEYLRDSRKTNLGECCGVCERCSHTKHPEWKFPDARELEGYAFNSNVEFRIRLTNGREYDRKVQSVIRGGDMELLPGFTFLGKRCFPFAVRCSKMKFVQFLVSLDRDYEHEVMTQCGFLTREIVFRYPEVFGFTYSRMRNVANATNRHMVASVADSLWALSPVEFVNGTCPQFGYEYDRYIRSSVPLYMNIVVGFVWYFFNAWLEEDAKVRNVSPMTFASIEFCFKMLSNGGVYSPCFALPWLMHSFVFPVFPFWIRVFVHCFYNMSVTYLVLNVYHFWDWDILYSSEYGTAMSASLLSFLRDEHVMSCLQSVESIAFVTDFLIKIGNGDWLGFVCSVAMKATFIIPILEFLELDDVSQFRVTFEELRDSCSSPVDFPDSEGEVKMLGYERFSNVVKALFPEKISASPFVKKVMALVMVLVMTPFGMDLSSMTAFSNFISWDSLPDGGSFIDTAFAAMHSCYKAFSRVMEPTASWMDMFDYTDSVSFTLSANKMLAVDHSILKTEELEVPIGEIGKLVELRLTKVNDVAVQKLVERLSILKLNLEKRFHSAWFLTESYKLLNVNPDTCCDTFLESESKLDLARKLIAKQESCERDFAKDRILMDLRAYVLNLERFVRNQRVRIAPFPIVLCGPPGVGKTTQMTLITDYLAQSHEFGRFAGDVVAYNLYCKFPVSTGCHSGARFLHVNDIAADYSQFQQQGLVPLDVLLQQAIDEYPFEIPMAAVEDKGKNLNQLKFIMLTSNHTTLNCSGDSTKLVRRLQSGVVANVYVVGENGKELSFKQWSALPQGKRNDAMRFELYETRSSGKHLVFEPYGTRLVYNLHEFFRALDEKSKAHFANAQVTAATLKSGDNKCACGLTKAMHASGNSLVEISPRCDIFAFETLIEECSTESLGWLVSDFWYLLIIFYLMCCPEARVFKDLLELRFSSYINSCVDRALINPAVNAVVVRSIEFTNSVEDLDVKLRAIKLRTVFAKMRVFCNTYRYHLAAFMTAVSLYFVTKSSTVKSLGPAIYRENVDLQSISFMESTEKQRWSEQQSRDWGKTSDTMEMVKLTKVGTSFDDLKRICNNSVKDCIVYKGGKCAVAKLVVWSPDWISINKHFVYDLDAKSYCKSFNLECGGMTQSYVDSECIPLGESEFFLIHNTFFPEAVDLNSFLAEVPRAAFQVWNQARDTSCPAFSSSFIAPSDGAVYRSLAWEEDNDTGMCGNLVLANVSGGWFIAACVAAKVTMFLTRKIYTHASVITRTDYSNACLKTAFPQISHFVVEALGMNTDLSPKSQLRLVKSPYLLPLGTKLGASQTFHTRLVKTKFHDDFIDMMSEPYLPPGRIHGVVDGEYYSAFASQFENITLSSGVTKFALRRAMLSYLNDALPPKKVDERKIKLRPLSLAEAFFGSEDIGVSRINFKTSLGGDWSSLGCKNKYDLFEQKEDGTFALRADFKSQVEKLVSMCKKGVLTPVTVALSPKDELRKAAKVLFFAIRLFSVLDFVYNAALRMFAMPIIQVLMNYPHESECYGGMNAGSHQWHDLASRLKTMQFFLDMDFKTYDSTHRQLAFTIVAEFFYLAAIRLGYTVEDATVLYYLIKCLCVQLLKFMNDFALKKVGMPSGVIITLIMNSIINSILMRMAYEILTKLPLETFQSNVVTATVGDDNASGISGRIIANYNMRAIQKLYLTWGYVVTPALKGDVVLESLPFEALTFVKRMFVMSPDIKQYIAPIAIDSIYKPFLYQEKGEGVSSLQRLLDLSLAQQREAFLHGKPFFEKFQAKLTQVFENHRMIASLKYLSFDALVEEYHNNGFRTFDC
jgi:hypothetical protein